MSKISASVKKDVIPTKKLKSRKGFTLVEMLCVVALLAMFSLCIVIGVDMCVKTFHTTMAFSDAQTLSSTVTSLISDELRYASRIKTSEAGSGEDPKLVSYSSQNYGADATIKTKKILGRGKHELRALYIKDQSALGQSAYTDDCSIEDLIIRYNKDLKTFTVEFKIVNIDGKKLDTVHCQVKSLQG